VVSAGTDRNAETVVVPSCCAAASGAVRLANVIMKVWLAPIFRMVVPLEISPDRSARRAGAGAIATPLRARL
jgi:hypothetical protein